MPVTGRCWCMSCAECRTFSNSVCIRQKDTRCPRAVLPPSSDRHVSVGNVSFYSNLMINKTARQVACAHPQWGEGEDSRERCRFGGGGKYKPHLKKEPPQPQLQLAPPTSTESGLGNSEFSEAARPGLNVSFPCV